VSQRIDTLLERARRSLERVSPQELADEVAAGAVLVDIRPAADRASEGELPGAIVIERNVLEWRLDPTSEHRLAIASDDARIIVVCNEGYASSLAAHSLQQLGVTRATDLDGGYRGWRHYRPRA
jgi:rhodanese-related sulfurtransferase